MAESVLIRLDGAGEYCVNGAKAKFVWEAQGSVVVFSCSGGGACAVTYACKGDSELHLYGNGSDHLWSAHQG